MRDEEPDNDIPQDIVTAGLIPTIIALFTDVNISEPKFLDSFSNGSV